MIKKSVLFFLFISLSILVYATHNRAGYIQYSVVPNTGCLTYNFKVVTFTRTSSFANASRDTLRVFWGDNTSSLVSRDTDVLVGTNYPDVSYNVYHGTHTFPGPGIDTIMMTDPNRNDSVLNMVNSVDQPFFIETTLTISPYTGCDNSPVVLNPPIDRGEVGVPFYYTPNAYDPDGDSLSYVLVPCREGDGMICAGYFFPPASNSFNLNPVTGLLTWDSPEEVGQFNVAMLIEEWRNGQNIGHVTLDMQIIITTCHRNMPYINPVPDTCVLAGDNYHFSVTAGNSNHDQIYIYATGAPLTLDGNNCTFTANNPGNPTISGFFNWTTACSDVREQPYQICFLGDDVYGVNFLDTPCVTTVMKNVNITVIAPAPQNPVAMATGNNIEITWNQSPCTKAIGYKVYRRNGLFNGTIQCPCQTGVPSGTGYSLIATVIGLDSTFYWDTNHGVGLNHGIDYCYMITAIFADGSESCASVQTCAELKKDAPIITNVSVDTTDATAGAMYIAWSAPNQLNDTLYPGPYVYKIYRSNGTGMNLISSTPSSVNFNDTIYYDDLAVNQPFNTRDYGWTYRIDLYSNDTLVDQSQVASSVYLSLSTTNHTINLSWSENVPWMDTTFVIYRQNHFTGNWDSIGYTASNSFSNTGLANDTVYCYYVKSVGLYTAPGFVYPIINNSEQKCASSIDNVYPCSPNLTINVNCVAHVDSLIWNNPNNTCASGVIEYKIYIDTAYTTDTGSFKLLATISDVTDTTYIYNDAYSIAGCFKVTALDSVLNETQVANVVCVDNCPEYTLPNIFTPNGDGINDYFHPFPYSFVKDIDIEIFDRWGIKMFSTTNPDIMWDGTNQSTKGKCPDGVYYYICKVHEIHYNGIRTVTLKGNIELLRDKK